MESEICEYKESLAKTLEGGDALCGFANQNGGVVYFGIDDKGKAVGISNITEKTIRDVTQTLFDNIEPQMTFSVTTKKIKGRSIIKVKVRKSSTPYHTFKKVPYIRIGTSTKRMPQEEYQRRLIQYRSTNKDYSSTLISDLTISDLSPQTVTELRRLLIQSGRYEVDISRLSDVQMLKDLLLMQENKLTLASLILLGTEESVSRFLPFAEIRYGYKLSEKEIRNQDTLILRGGYLLYYNKLWEKIQSRNITLSIPIGLRVVERSAFDEQTTREAVNNIIIHREYLFPESSFILQYPTKIIFKNPGGFPEGVTLENIIYESKPRNKLLADILFKCELVEQFGNGVNLMYKNQLSLGKLPPNYSQSNDSRVVLGIDGAIQDIEFAKYVMKVAEAKNKILTVEELLTLHRIKNNEKVNTNKIIEELLELGLIERVGYKKFILSKTYYFDTKQEGKYTKRRGLSRETNKELILQHLKTWGGATKKAVAQIFNFELTDKQIAGLLKDLKDDGKIFFDGPRRSPKAEWRIKNETPF